MKNLKIKAFRTFILATTSAMTLNMTSCGKDAKDLVIYENSEDFTINNQPIEPTIQYENISGLLISSDATITIKNDNWEELELTINSTEEIKDFISKCTNLQKITVFQDVSNIPEILNSIPNPNKITRLTIFEKMTSLDMIKNFPNLEYLRLDNAQTDDLSPLSDLLKLESLEIHHTTAESLDDLKNLTKCSALDLAFNGKLKNITVLENYKKLEDVNLSYTSVETMIWKRLRNIKT